MMTIAAIDPGSVGGVARMDDDGHISFIRLHNDFSWVREVVKEYCTGIDVWIEDVGKHREGNNASSSAKFAFNCGFLNGTLLEYARRVVPVVPIKWMTHLPDRPRGSSPSEKKARKVYIQKWVHERTGMLVPRHSSDAVAMLLLAKEGKLDGCAAIQC